MAAARCQQKMFDAPSGNYTEYCFWPIFTFTALNLLFFFVFSVLSIRPYLDSIQMTSIFICHFPYTINQTPKADKSVPNSAFKNRFFISEILKLLKVYKSLSTRSVTANITVKGLLEKCKH